MPVIPRPRRWLSLAVLLAGTVTGLAVAAPGRSFGAPEAGDQDYVKYYVVASSYQGKPENLTEIATRFLGGAERSGELFNLNSTRVQPDGGKLNDPANLRAGWTIVLPWDAVGAEVKYGQLSVTPPGKPQQPSGGTAAPPPPPTARPDAHASTPPGCVGSSSRTSRSDSQWGMLRLAPDRAWTYSRGAQVMVAIVDSGVDAGVAQLAGHVTVGADIVSGTGRGDVDCLGTGTAMAAIVAARADSGGFAGIAPDATLLPVRVVTTDPHARTADQASAIGVAVSAGARVIALGSYVNPQDPAVASAIAAAASRDVLVVTAAPVRAAGGGPDPLAGHTDPVLRVGGMGIDGSMAASYVPNATDVVAPGVGVASLGISGTGQFDASGTQYAVAFAAGEAALVRARYPDLRAAQVVRRIEATADRMGSTAPDSTYGWGLIDPAAAVTRVIPDERRGPAPPDAAATHRSGSALRNQALVVTLLVALVLAVLVILRVRRIVRPATAAASAESLDTVPSPQPLPAPPAAAPARGRPVTVALPEPEPEPGNDGSARAGQRSIRDEPGIVPGSGTAGSTAPPRSPGATVPTRPSSGTRGDDDA